MKKLHLIFILYSFIFLNTDTHSRELDKKFLKSIKFQQKNVDKAFRGSVQSISKVESYEENGAEFQTLNFRMVGVHPNRCKIALRKISLYEEYSDFISFIKKVEFSEENKKLAFFVDHKLMPYPMVLGINIGRVSRPGSYPYTFDKGLFSGLKGTIVVKDYKRKCLIAIHNSWTGKHTKIPNLVIEIFSQTLMRIGMEKVFRFSRI